VQPPPERTNPRALPWRAGCARKGGYLHVCTEGRVWFETDYPDWLREEPPLITST